jgi:glycosyltransferase involved in cell wall biosynthesis
MKVAIVLNTSWNIYNFRKGLIDSLLTEGHEIHCIAPKDNFSEKLVELGCKYHIVRMDSRGANPIKDLALTLELLSIYKRIQPDVIFHYTIKPNIYGTIAARLLRIPTVNNVCGLGTVFLKEGLVSRIAMFLYRFAFRFPKKIFFQNYDDQDLFISRSLVAKEITDVLPGSGINLSHFKPLQVTIEKEKRFTFLMISRLIYDKGVVEYIDAIKELRKRNVLCNFQILGAKDPKHKRGIDPKLIDAWVEEGLVDYLGTTEDVRNLLSHADCVVLPSYREGTPRTLLEAASLAKPLIATNVPGCRNVVKHNFNGFLCELRSGKDLADKMEDMYKLAEEKRRSFGANSRRLVENEFDEQIVIDKYIQLLKPQSQLATSMN